MGSLVTDRKVTPGKVAFSKAWLLIIVNRCVISEMPDLPELCALRTEHSTLNGRSVDTVDCAEPASEPKGLCHNQHARAMVLSCMISRQMLDFTPLMFMKHALALPPHRPPAFGSVDFTAPFASAERSKQHKHRMQRGSPVATTKHDSDEALLACIAVLRMLPGLAGHL